MTRLVVVALSIGATLVPVVDQQAIFRASADAVWVNVSVDRGSKRVDDLKAADFRLLDNGVEQIVRIAAIDEIPIDVTLVLDARQLSPDVLKTIKNGVEVIARTLPPTDRLRLWTCDDRLHDVFGWRFGGSSVELGSVLSSQSGAIYDALVFAMMQPAQRDRRHLIVAITDGRDGDSFINSAVVKDIALRSESILHVVQVPVRVDLPTRGRSHFYPVYLEDERDVWIRLAAAAASTGGGLHRPPLIGNVLVRGFEDAFRDFRSGYVLWYVPTGVPETGWHQIAVDVNTRQGVQIRARNGYYNIVRSSRE